MPSTTTGSSFARELLRNQADHIARGIINVHPLIIDKKVRYYTSDVEDYFVREGYTTQTRDILKTSLAEPSQRITDHTLMSEALQHRVHDYTIFNETGWKIRNILNRSIERGSPIHLFSIPLTSEIKRYALPIISINASKNLNYVGKIPLIVPN